MKKLFAAAVAVTLAACSSVSDASFAFSGAIERRDAAPSPPIVTAINTVGASSISATGQITTPCWNDLITLDGDRSGSNLTVRVERTAQTPCTDTRTRYHTYQGFFANVRSGTYLVRIVDATQGGETVLLEKSVVVQ